MSNNNFEEMKAALITSSNFLRMQYTLIDKFAPLRKINSTVNDLCEYIQDFNEKVKPVLAIQRVLAKLQFTLQDYETNTYPDLLLLAEHGWYIDFDTDLHFHSEVATELRSGNIAEAQTKLVDFYKENQTNTFNKLSNRHPQIAHIFAQIQSAISRGEYYTAIPCMLTVVDNICIDSTTSKFFIKEPANNYLPQVTAVFQRAASNNLHMYLSPILNQTPIMVLEKNLDTFPCKLNRHKIIHGNDISYGTEVNALKVLSLLSYISDLLFELGTPLSQE